jgi:hypothetical protein
MLIAYGVLIGSNNSMKQKACWLAGFFSNGGIRSDAFSFFTS